MKYFPIKIVLFFLGLMVLGTMFLSLPVARNDKEFFFATNLFMSVSAVCVTGFSVVNICEYYSTFGQVVILFLVQLGGVGYMFVSIVATLLFGKMALKDRYIMQDMFDVSSFNKLKRFIFKATLFVLGIEFVGSVILTFIFLINFPLLKSIRLGIFYSVMAFCNAGFSFFDDSLVRFANSPLVLYVIAILIFFGSIGFFVMVDIYDTYKEKRLHLSTHTKVVLFMSTIIIFFAFLLFLFSGALLGRHEISYSINNAFFQAVSTRTAGFYSVPINLFNGFTKLVVMLLMLIGAAPGSTGGGIKITTFALIFAFLRSVLKSENVVVLFQKSIPEDLIKKALAVFIIFLILIVSFLAVFVFIDGDCLRTFDIAFDVVSAFATSGLSLNVISSLSISGKVLIILAMILGRIGILTILIVILTPVHKKKNIKHPEVRILVG
jgi:trk system potassium uptake protein TrkH